jgi:hypothetical protein
LLGIDDINKAVNSVFNRKRVATVALCRYYAGIALETFRMLQTPGQLVEGEFWTNRTQMARDGVFAKTFTEANAVGFFLAHTVGYGVYLELANNRAHESLRPTIESLMPMFQRDLGELWAR